MRERADEHPRACYADRGSFCVGLREARSGKSDILARGRGGELLKEQPNLTLCGLEVLVERVRYDIHSRSG